MDSIAYILDILSICIGESQFNTVLFIHLLSSIYNQYSLNLKNIFIKCYSLEQLFTTVSMHAPTLAMLVLKFERGDVFPLCILGMYQKHIYCCL